MVYYDAAIPIYGISGIRERLVNSVITRGSLHSPYNSGTAVVVARDEKRARVGGIGGV